VYLTHGKIFLFEILGFLVGLVALHAWQAPRAGGLEKWGFRLALVGSVLLIVGLIGAFWVGTIWVGAVGFSYFAFVVPAYSLMVVGWTLFGIGTSGRRWRRGWEPGCSSGAGSRAST
jgi:hypothetical protein